MSEGEAGIGDREALFARFVGSYEECKQRFGLDAEAVVETVMGMKLR